MPLHIGLPGRLVAFPNLQKDYERPLARLGGFHMLADGSTVFDLVGYQQTFTLSGRGLSDVELGELDRLIYTRGPLVVVDPAQRNYLTPNQSTGTDERTDARGLNVSAGTVASSAAQAWEGARSLAWSYPSSMPAGEALRCADGLPFQPADPLFGVPVVAGEPYTFSVYLRLEAGSEDFLVRLEWFDAAGGSLGIQDAAPAPVTTAWARQTVTGTAPAPAAYARALVVSEGTGATGTLHADALQLEHAAAASTWVAGRGVPLCSIVSELGGRVPIIRRHHVTLTLRQAVAY